MRPIPREHYDLHTMTVAESGHHAESWREGDLGASSGMEVLNAIKSGNIWLNPRKVTLVSEPYRALLEQIFSEVEVNVPGLKTFKHNFGILMSSPTAQVFYHSDILGQSLWQIRGRKRVFVYPIEAPFITPEAIEKIILNEADEQDMPYFAAIRRERDNCRSRSGPDAALAAQWSAPCGQSRLLQHFGDHRALVARNPCLLMPVTMPMAFWVATTWPILSTRPAGQCSGARPPLPPSTNSPACKNSANTSALSTLRSIRARGGFADIPKRLRTEF